MRWRRDSPHRPQVRAVLLALLCVAGCQSSPTDADVPPITGTWETRDPRQGWRFTLSGDRGSTVRGRYSNEGIPALGDVQGSYHFPRVRLVFTVYVGFETRSCMLRGEMETGGDQIPGTASCSARNREDDVFTMTLVRTG